jgi:hypothetical protein
MGASLGGLKRVKKNNVKHYKVLWPARVVDYCDYACAAGASLQTKVLLFVSGIQKIAQDSHIP